MRFVVLFVFLWEIKDFSGVWQAMNDLAMLSLAGAVLSQLRHPQGYTSSTRSGIRTDCFKESK